MDWDDLRYVLAVGRQGTLSAAARALGVNHSTVFRRIGLIEEKLGVRLFERARDGYTPTPACEEVTALAERMEGDVNDLERRLAGRDTRPSGLVRVTTTDTLLLNVLLPVFAGFRRAHHEIRLEVIADNRFFSLSKRDADVAIRPCAEPPETLVGRRIATINTAIYGARNFLDTISPGDGLADHTWIAPDESLMDLPSARWLQARLKQTEPAFRTNSVNGMLAAARAGLGLTLLPCFLGDASPELRRTQQPIEELSSALWLLTHRDLQQVARVRVFLDFLHAGLRPLQSAFEGQQP